MRYLAILFVAACAVGLAAQGGDLLARARALHREAPLIDGHNDYPWALREHDTGRDLASLDIRVAQPAVMTDIPRLRAGGVGGQFWSVYVPVSLQGPEAVIATLGHPAYDLFAAGDRLLNFYTWGSMGMASSIGLGLALARPDRRVIVCDGDGSLLMNLGALATIGVMRPANLTMIVWDNALYGTTGGQPSATAAGADLAAASRALGVPASSTVCTPDELTAALAGRSIKVVAPQPRQAQRALAGLPGVLSVAQVGNDLRVLAGTDGDVVARVRKALADAGLQAEVAGVAPNLEDVFVDATRGRVGQERAA